MTKVMPMEKKSSRLYINRDALLLLALKQRRLTTEDLLGIGESSFLIMQGVIHAVSYCVPQSSF